MRTTRRLVVSALAAGLIAVPSSLPALAQSGSASEITHRQSVLTEVSPTGETEDARIFTQLTVAGDGQVAVALPGQSTRGLRNLVGFGRPRVDGDTVHLDVAARPEGTLVRTVADHVGEDPVEFEITYHLDGQPVEPSDVVGESGRLTVTYTVSNRTSQPVELQFADGKRRSRTETVDVAVPLVGSLSVTLDDRFTGVEAPGAAVAGDGRGNTVVNFSLLLFSPIGSEEQTISYSADVVDAIVPEARAQILPVSSESFGSLKSSEDAYQGAVLSTRELTRGAMQLDQGVQQLGRGSSSLLNGLVQLRDGMQELSQGLNERAAPGARQVSEGLGAARSGGNDLANGLGDLRDGANRLTAGMVDARNGGIRLSDGLGTLAGGAGDLRDGARQVSGGASQLDEGAGDLAAGSTQLRDGASGLLAGLQQLHSGLNAPDGLPQAIGGTAQLIAGVNGVGLPAGQPFLLGGIDGVRHGLSNPGCDPTAAPGTPTACGVKEGVQSINAGALALRDKLESQNDAGEPVAMLAALSGNLTDALNSARNALLMVQGDPGFGDLDLVTQGTVSGTIAGLGTPLVPGPPPEAPTGAFAAAAGVGQIGEGLADSFDPTTKPAIPADCPTLLAGPTPDTAYGALTLMACGSLALSNGIGTTTDPPGTTTTILGGLATLRAGIDNPLHTFATCSTDPSAPAQDRCGLLEGLQLLRAGLQDALATVNDGLGSTSDAPTASLLGGANALADGSSDLAAGAQRLKDEGTAPLAAGANRLSGGATQLADGAGTASSGSRDLVSGLRQLANGGSELVAGAGRAARGAGDLRDGLVQLDDGMQELADGIDTAADGSTQVADGLVSAANGGGLVDGGVTQLREEGILVLADAVSDASGDAELLLETVKAVDDRGKNGEGLPYGTVEGAQASAVFQYDIAGVGSESGPSTGVQLLLAIVALSAAGALAIGIRRLIT